MRKLLAIIMFGALAQLTLAQDQALVDTIKADYLEQQALSQTSALPDAAQLARYVYPPLLEAFGGAEAYLELIEAAKAYGQADDGYDAYDDYEENDYEKDDYEKDDYDEGGFSLSGTREELSVGPIYRAGGELQTVLSVRTVETYADDAEPGYFRDDIYTRHVLAISRDEGEHWYFLEEMDWDSVVPELHPDIEQPPEDMETRFREE
jgi:hypothetical protein